MGTSTPSRLGRPADREGSIGPSRLPGWVTSSLAADLQDVWLPVILEMPVILEGSEPSWVDTSAVVYGSGRNGFGPVRVTAPRGPGEQKEVRKMARRARGLWVGLICCGLAILGLSAAITTVVGPVAKPAAEGTCGPGKSSEAAVTAFFDPASIGAGKEPSATNLEARLDWLAFVGECQSSADGQMLRGGILLAPAVIFGVVGVFSLADRRSRRRDAPSVSAFTPAYPSGPPWLQPSSSRPVPSPAQPPPI